MIKELREEPIFRFLGRGEREQVGMAPPTNREMMNKINELVERVNVLSKALAVVMESCTIPLVDRLKIHRMLDETRSHIDHGEIVKHGEE